MKIIKNDGTTFSIQALPDKEPIYLTVELTDGKGWSRAVKLMVDTGNTGSPPLLLPKSLIKELGLTLPPVTTSEGILADGSTVKEDVVMVGIRFLAIPSKIPVMFLEVPASVSDGAGMGLIGLDLLSYCNVVMKNGALVLLELSNDVGSTQSPDR